MSWIGLDWIEHGFTSAPTQYRLYDRRFYRSDDPTNSVKALKEVVSHPHRPQSNHAHLTVDDSCESTVVLKRKADILSISYDILIHQ